MKLISQKDPYGCSLACIAFLVSKDYEYVLKFVDVKKAQELGFTCKELIILLEKIGLDYSYKYIKPRLMKYIYNDGVIVFIKRSKRYPSGHYLIRYKDKWMDPWINFSKEVNIVNAKAGFRTKLPGTPIYFLYNGALLKL